MRSLARRGLPPRARPAAATRQCSDGTPAMPPRRGQPHASTSIWRCGMSRLLLALIVTAIVFVVLFVILGVALWVSILAAVAGFVLAWLSGSAAQHPRPAS